MKLPIAALIVGCLCFAAANPAAAAKHKLTDAELDKVTAGGTSKQTAADLQSFQFQGQAGSTHTVKGSGTLSIKSDSLPPNSPSLILQGEAQQNLRSLVNINAVNSHVQVLVNLNISIDSTIGVVNQSNTSQAH